MLRRPRAVAARRLAASAAAVAVLATVSGCVAEADPGAESPATSSTTDDAGPSTSGTTDGEPMVYVAMGDSYTAAPLDPLDDAKIIDDCLRSAENYPTLVAAELGIDVTDVSCSGASTVSIFGPQKFTTITQPPQIDAITTDADLVTIGIGANDFTFFTKMVFDCLDVADTDVEGAPCRDKNVNARGSDKLQRNLVKIRHNVERVVTAVAERAPDARILLVGYPQIIPSEGTCQPRLPLALGDYAYVLDLNLQLSEAVEEGGTAAGAEFIDMVAASQGHDICSDEPWVAGIRGKDNFAAGLHPYPAEQKAVAELVLERL